ncbi:MAG: pseudouridine-5'-phosphate glycosidase, partial [Chloroflexi bacterium]|nr:pseudouridine-5'-phosphate glycosidase [Chloroflexota bacterium]
MQGPPEGRPRLPDGVRLGNAVAAALDAGRPVVALETAVVTHGLPPPQNLQALDDMRQEVEAAGATPAVCLVHEGVLCIGADADAVRAVADDPEGQKISVRDLGAAIALGASGGLTVSATLLAAQLAGIRVFATGGIGGVHTGGAGDVSADLHQLARSPVITVCSGAKSVLDIPRTLEFLETAGVPVFGYRTSTF